MERGASRSIIKLRFYQDKLNVLAGSIFKTDGTWI